MRIREGQALKTPDSVSQERGTKVLSLCSLRLDVQGTKKEWGHDVISFLVRRTFGVFASQREEFIPSLLLGVRL